MKAKNAPNVSDRSLSRTSTRGGAVRTTKPCDSDPGYPRGSVGANVPKRDYVKYLIERYLDHREADLRSGRTARLSYALIFKNIETTFNASTFFIPESRFPELVEYLQGRIDSTVLGRASSKRGISNYRSFDEYVMEHAEPAAIR